MFVAIIRPWDQFVPCLEKPLTHGLNSNGTNKTGQLTISFTADTQGGHTGPVEHVEIAIVSPSWNIIVREPHLIVTASIPVPIEPGPPGAIEPQLLTPHFTLGIKATPLLPAQRTAPNDTTIDHGVVRAAQTPKSAPRRPSTVGAPIQTRRLGVADSHTQPSTLTPRFFLKFQFRRKHYSLTFSPIVSDTDLLTHFETSLSRAVRKQDKKALQESLEKGYSLELGYWGRTIRQRIRGAGVTFPVAAFNAFLNSVRADSYVTIV
jgi:hypothetical protein